MQPRDRIILAPKVAGPARRPWIRNGRTDLSPRSIAEAARPRASGGCSTDYIDLFQIHWPQRYVPIFGASQFDPANYRPDAPPIREQLEASAAPFRPARSATSACRMKRLMACASSSRRREQWTAEAATVQNATTCNLTYEQAHSDLAQRDRNVPLLAYSPLAFGPVGQRRRGRHQPRLSGGRPAAAHVRRRRVRPLRLAARPRLGGARPRLRRARPHRHGLPLPAGRRQLRGSARCWTRAGSSPSRSSPSPRGCRPRSFAMGGEGLDGHAHPGRAHRLRGASPSASSWRPRRCTCPALATALAAAAIVASAAAPVAELPRGARAGRRAARGDHGRPHRPAQPPPALPPPPRGDRRGRARSAARPPCC